MSKNDELILCFDKNLLNNTTWPNITVYEIADILRIPGVLQYKRRGDVETDMNILQPIPYCIVFCRTTERILSYKRSKKGGETRLHDMYSIGFGGHVNIDDVKACISEAGEFPENPVSHCAYRELEEELALTADKIAALRLFDWYIYDSTSEVSSVHLGLPYLCVVDKESDIKLAEDTAIELKWLDIENPKDVDINNTHFESWSEIALAKLIETSNGGRRARARDMLVQAYGMDEDTAAGCVRDMLEILSPLMGEN